MNDARRPLWSIPLLAAFLAALVAAPARTDEADDRTASIEARIDSLRTEARYGEAVSVAETLLVARREDPDAEPWDVGDAERLIATLRLAASLPEDKRRTLADADSLSRMVDSLSTEGKYEPALEIAERESALRRGLLGERSAETLSSLRNLAILCEDTGDFERSAGLLRELLPLHDEVLGTDHPMAIYALDRLASTLQRSGNFDEAEDLFRTALSRSRAAFGDVHERTMITMNNLGVLLHYRGEYDEAALQYGKVLAICRDLYGDEHENVGTILNNLGGLHVFLGDYAKAEPLYREALAIRRKLLNADHPDIAETLNNLGVLLKLQGNYEEAETLYEESLEIRRRAFPEGHPRIVQSINNLAVLAHSRKDARTADSLYAEVLEGLRKAFPGDHPETANTLNNLAWVRDEEGRHEEAVALHRETIAMYRSVFEDRHPLVARGLMGLATAQRRLGEPAAAESLYREALAMRREILGDDHPDVMLNLRWLAGLLLDEGRTAEAFAAAMEAEGSSRRHLRWTARTMAERAALRYAEVRPSGRDVTLTVLADGGEPDPAMVVEGWDAVARARALVLDEIMARRRLLQTVQDDELRGLVDRYHETGQRLANLSVRGPGRRAEEYRKRLDVLRREMESAERELAEASAPFREGVARHAAGIRSIAAAIPDHGALVAYSWYRHGPTKEPIDSYVAFVWTRGAEAPIVVPLGPARVIDDMISEWRGLMSGGIRLDEPSCRRTGESLRQLVWDPLADELTDVRAVFLVPDGAINLLSFAALPTAQEEYIVESGLTFHYLSAERGLSRRHHTVGTGALVLGAPDYDAVPETVVLAQADGPSPPIRTRGVLSGCDGFASLRFAPLDGTQREVDEIVARWTDDSGGMTYLVAGEASEGAFKAHAPGRRIIHVSTHGFFLPGGCGDAEGLRGIGGLVRMDLAPSAPENPLLLAGLAFAGANRRKSPTGSGDDGVLTALEIGTLDLSGAEWVVLSACDTGVGTVRAGEGVFGMRRAFEIAGARTLIMSLRSVEDESTREWMTSLYDARHERGLGAADCVREASLAILRDRRERGDSTHPFYWGAFVAAGGD